MKDITKAKLEAEIKALVDQVDKYKKLQERYNGLKSQMNGFHRYFNQFKDNNNEDITFVNHIVHFENKEYDNYFTYRITKCESEISAKHDEILKLKTMPKVQ
jgi:hypothetical protein